MASDLFTGEVWTRRELQRLSVLFFSNMLERVNQEMKRRTRVIRIFPNEQACVRLVSTLMMELGQEWMERIYLRMEVNGETAGEAAKTAA